MLFVALYQLLELAVMTGLSRFVSLRPSGAIAPSLALVREFGELLAVGFATAAMARIEGRSVFSYGFSGGKTWLRLASGAMCGMVCLSALVGILWYAGALMIDGMDAADHAVWGHAAAWGLVFILVGIFEESLLRGYLQFTLAKWLGFWPAALLLSTIFALQHTRNGGESILGILTVGAGGLLFCVSLWYTKSLWWAVGFHAGWDWGQSFFYGTPNSGYVMQGHLFATHPAGSQLLSGGTAGPEASILVLPVLLLTALFTWRWWGRSVANA